ncbi:MAG: family 1 encapsulin nanocompartment shell protein [Aminobacterium sp.]|jgi:uncharacterized linocin/CFP29 family protein|uniref:family 1 encapsulin nanocompartment shell protein n=1 Tax=Aminobacterium sp. MB27-C1 TaxID=3070661 RepID=UPI001BD05E8B|nr:family 1 encapsulin nanocompartment shell protein [Aminobacterium sp. MB27-C1]MDD2207211.1 family 1 encapsulin nanocompartment shell protein [Aminobacterium sp.]MDD3426795.1 family 1 encapsulin nanocompartment shell protein [Aminobacterium sp.]MDD3707203.1 family 1 encapsulin nanocompartment shell protein [Aminobacterium sp.]MDD4551955.1 family 1 encapsulin nanocompartment shell protein [Aminobacterium sp.]WMI71156.1 family 1 encapsulin nanocompartment shell protein [Aminobacterium sp. MB27
MDILRRTTEMVSQEAWHEMDEQAKRVLESHLSARKFIDVAPPKGWDYAAHPCGRLEVQSETETTKNNVAYGIHQVLPLVEPRITFDLDLWELDNITRGLKNPDLAPLEEAARNIAIFEERAIYEGLPSAGIVGLAEAAKDRMMPMTDTSSVRGIMDAISSALYRFQKDAVEGPYALVASPELWKIIYSVSECYPLIKNIKEVLNGPVILSTHEKESFLVSTRGDDMELVIGQDLSLGFVGNDSRKGTFFFTESFTFRVINPEAIIPLRIS